MFTDRGTIHVPMKGNSEKLNSPHSSIFNSKEDVPFCSLTQMSILMLPLYSQPLSHCTVITSLLSVFPTIICVSPKPNAGLGTS